MSQNFLSQVEVDALLSGKVTPSPKECVTLREEIKINGMVLYDIWCTPQALAWIKQNCDPAYWYENRFQGGMFVTDHIMSIIWLKFK